MHVVYLFSTLSRFSCTFGVNLKHFVMNNTEKVYNVFAEALNIDKSTITEDLKYQSIPQWDSISHMVLISTLEETFDVSIATNDVIDMSSVGKVIEILKKYNIQF